MLPPCGSRTVDRGITRRSSGTAQHIIEEQAFWGLGGEAVAFFCRAARPDAQKGHHGRGWACRACKQAFVRRGILFRSFRRPRDHCCLWATRVVFVHWSYLVKTQVHKPHRAYDPSGKGFAVSLLETRGGARCDLRCCISRSAARLSSRYRVHRRRCALRRASYSDSRIEGLGRRQGSSPLP